MACPYFLPTEAIPESQWTVRPGMPLGQPWRGMCGAPGAGNCDPSIHELKTWCNFGYARCGRCPADRVADKVSYMIPRREGNLLLLWYAFERDHRPVEHGSLQYDIARAVFLKSPESPVLRLQAEAYVKSYLQHKIEMNEQLRFAYNVPTAGAGLD